MAAIATTVLAVVSLLLLPRWAARHVRAQQETDDEDEFSYRSGAENGPERWGHLRGDWATCSWGKLQAPISLPAGVVGVGVGVGARLPGAHSLSRSYRPSPATLVNRGHDIMVRFDGDAGSLLIDGVAYRLRQMHWHSPSEHTVGGRRYDLELHMLHQSDVVGKMGSSKYAVVAQLYEIGRHRDDTLRKLERYVRRIAGKRKGHEVEIGHDVDPRRPIRGSEQYYRYTGSFTTPPCTEGITWTVSTKVRHVSRQQVEMLRDAVHDGARKNARPLQEANGRGVGMCYNWPRGREASLARAGSISSTRRRSSSRP